MDHKTDKLCLRTAPPPASPSKTSPGFEETFFIAPFKNPFTEIESRLGPFPSSSSSNPTNHNKDPKPSVAPLIAIPRTNEDLINELKETMRSGGVPNGQTANVLAILSDLQAGKCVTGCYQNGKLVGDSYSKIDLTEGPVWRMGRYM